MFREVVRDRLLISLEDERAIWLELPRRFVSALTDALNTYGWRLQVQGYPDLTSFSLLVNGDPDGNSWFVKLYNPDGKSAWLLWYGFGGASLADLLGRPTRYPSVMLSIRDPDPSSIHPWKQVMGYYHDVPNEIVFRPLERLPVIMRWGYNIQERTIEADAGQLAETLTAHKYPSY